jgi:cytochrome c553
MKQSIIIALLLLAITNTAIAADIAAGKGKAVMCAACHGADGNSINPEWPNLAGQNADYLTKQIIAFRDGSRVNAQMAPMVAALSDQDAENIAAYYASLDAKSGATKEEYVALGSQIYTGGVTGVMACTACHGPKGDGLGAAGFPKVSGQQINYVINQLNNFKNGSRSNDSSVMMNNIAAAMTEEQITAVANYLSGLY